MSTLESIDTKLDALLQLLKGSAVIAPKPAYENPPIGSDEAVIDGVTVNKDGSIWDWDEGYFSGKRAPVKVTYGYISEAKVGKEVWEKMRAIGGPQFERWAATRDLWALYKVDPGPFVETGQPNWITLATVVLQPYGRHAQ